jgi:8-oxo-dGTP diphosphatase
MPVLLIRHAHAGSRSEWAGPDAERGLSDRGRKQATRLVNALREFEVDRILSSPYLRCIDTVVPLAEARDLKVEAVDILAEGSGPEAVHLVRSLANDNVALCTHGDVIPEILIALADEDRLDLGPRPRQAKGSVWVLETSKGRFNRALYLPPPG